MGTGPISLDEQREAEKKLYNNSGTAEGDSVDYQKELFEYLDHLPSNITSPQHYKRWAVQPYEFISQNNLEFWRGNIIKYVMRAGFKTKGGLQDREAEIEDLQKAMQYIDMRIKDIKGEPIE